MRASPLTIPFVALALAGCAATDQLVVSSEPPLATLRTAEGVTCATPCAVTVPRGADDVEVTVSKPGFVPQSVPVRTVLGNPVVSSSTSLVVALRPVEAAVAPGGPPRRGVGFVPRGDLRRTRTVIGVGDDGHSRYERDYVVRTATGYDWIGTVPHREPESWASERIRTMKSWSPF